MLKIFFLLSILGMVTASYCQNGLNNQLRIAPIRSTRADVEKVAVLKGMFGAYERYETRDAVIDIRYAQEPCIGHGWNVVPDTVIALRIYPKNQLSLNQALSSRKKGLVRTEGDDGTGYITDREKGRQFVTRNGEEGVDHIRITPKPSDDKLRCKGFPDFSAVSETYVAYQTIKEIEAAAWDSNEVYTTLAYVRNNKKLKGQIFIYCRKDDVATCQTLKRKVERVVERTPRHSRRISVQYGGHRETAEIETFVIPEEYPHATARPIYPSQETK